MKGLSRKRKLLIVALALGTVVLLTVAGAGIWYFYLFLPEKQMVQAVERLEKGYLKSLFTLESEHAVQYGAQTEYTILLEGSVEQDQEKNMILSVDEYSLKSRDKIESKAGKESFTLFKDKGRLRYLTDEKLSKKIVYHQTAKNIDLSDFDINFTTVPYTQYDFALFEAEYLDPTLCMEPIRDSIKAKTVEKVEKQGGVTSLRTEMKKKDIERVLSESFLQVYSVEDGSLTCEIELKGEELKPLKLTLIFNDVKFRTRLQLGDKEIVSNVTVHFEVDKIENRGVDRARLVFPEGESINYSLYTNSLEPLVGNRRAETTVVDLHAIDHTRQIEKAHLDIYGALNGEYLQTGKVRFAPIYDHGGFSYNQNDPDDDSKRYQATSALRMGVCALEQQKVELMYTHLKNYVEANLDKPRPIGPSGLSYGDFLIPEVETIFKNMNVADSTFNVEKGMDCYEHNKYEALTKEYMKKYYQEFSNKHVIDSGRLHVIDGHGNNTTVDFYIRSKVTQEDVDNIYLDLKSKIEKD